MIPFDLSRVELTLKINVGPVSLVSSMAAADGSPFASNAWVRWLFVFFSLFWWSWWFRWCAVLRSHRRVRMWFIRRGKSQVEIENREKHPRINELNWIVLTEILLNLFGVHTHTLAFWRYAALKQKTLFEGKHFSLWNDEYNYAYAPQCTLITIIIDVIFL